MLKKFLFVTALVVINYLAISAQTMPLKKSTHQVTPKAVELISKKRTDSLYSMADESLRKTISPKPSQSLFSKSVFQSLPPGNLTSEISLDSLNKYRIQGSDTALIYLSVGKDGLVTNIRFLPEEQKTTSAEMNADAKRIDSVARKMLRLINEKKTDSTYLLFAENFKKQMSSDAWKNLMEKSICPLTPFNEFIFLGNEDKISKYKSGVAQFLIALNQHNKIEIFAIQPYKDEVSHKKFNSDNPLKTRLDSVVNGPLSTYMRTKGNVGLSVGIYYGGKNYYFNYGETRLGNSQLPSNRTLYDIGSITKTFTSTLLALAVNEGKVKLSNPITSFLPDSVASNPALKGITLLQLANHTSGLPRMPSNTGTTVTDIGQPYENYDTKHLFSNLKNLKSTRPPGIKYDYSNMAVGLLGVILEKVYKMPYADLVAKYISKPAKLNQTKFTINGSDTTLLAQGYDTSLMPVAPWKFQALQAAGAIKSSATDLLSYGKLQLSDAPAPLSKAIKLTHVLTYKEDQTSIGLGWHFLNGDPKIVQHNGITGGYRSLVCVDLERNIAVVVLTNNASNGDRLGFEVLKALQSLK
jgi:CubicO group peptidase (beta-lactamase class C family)